MKLILCLALGLVLLSSGALLWKATRRASRQQTAADIVRDFHREDIERAKKQGKKEVILPPAIDMPTPPKSLDELLRNYGLLRVKVLDTEPTVSEPYADFKTWYKVEILKTLHQQVKVSAEPFPFEVPSRLLPLLPSESLLVMQGGEIIVDGVTVVREFSTGSVVLIPREEYLIVGYLEYGGKRISHTGRGSVFHVVNNRLMSGHKEHRLVREIEERYGNDLDLLRYDMRLRQGREK